MDELTTPPVQPSHAVLLTLGWVEVPGINNRFIWVWVRSKSSGKSATDVVGLDAVRAEKQRATSDDASWGLSRSG
jgi:hypothetical protein